MIPVFYLNAPLPFCGQNRYHLYFISLAEDNKKIYKKKKKISLDKLKKNCYNSLIIEGEDTKRPGIIKNETKDKDVCEI